MTDIIDAPDAQQTTDSDDVAASRRTLLSKGAIAAAVGAAAGIALSDQASAANGSNLAIGNVGATVNTATKTTRLEGGSSLEVLNGDSSLDGKASIYGTADGTAAYGIHGRQTGDSSVGNAVAGIYGTATGKDVAGVYGRHQGNSTRAGNGVTGQSQFGTGVYGTNTNSIGGLYGVRGNNSGTTGGGGVRGDALGTKAAGVYGRATGSESTGVEGESTGRAGTGIWGRHLSASPTDPGTGVLGVSDRGAGVRGVGTTYGVQGQSSQANARAVYGSHASGANAGTGVEGVSDNGVGVSGSGSTFDLQANASGIVYIAKARPAAITPTTPGSVGSIARSTDGSLWYCYAANKWRQLDLEAAGTTPVGPQYKPVTPFRVYDSRKDAGGKFSGGQNRTISVKDSRNVDTYAVVTADAVPVGATAVSGNVVAIGTSDTGFLAINPGGITAVTAATVNWTSGQNIGNAGTFSLNANREIQAVYGPGAGCHMTFDVTGYYA